MEQQLKLELLKLAVNTESPQHTKSALQRAKEWWEWVTEQQGSGPRVVDDLNPITAGTNSSI